MKLPIHLLEEWMRRYYFSAPVDIGSSGVRNLSLGEVRERTGLTQPELDKLVFQDSQTRGGDALRQVIATQWDSGDAGKIFVTNGSTEATFLAMNALLEAGDEVIVLAPCYQQLQSTAQTLGAGLTKWHLRPENSFRPDFKELRTLISHRTKMIVINFPHNPTGVSITSVEQRELVELAREVDAYLLWDGVFGDITYDRQPLSSPTLQYERAVSIGSLSKTFGLPGLRVGWCIAQQEILDRFINLRDAITLHLSPLNELLAARVIENAQEILTSGTAHATTNLELLEKWVSDNPEVFDWIRPWGGVCAFPRLRTTTDAQPFCVELAEKHGVLLVPGSCFGYPAHVRLGFGGPTSALREGLKEVSDLVSKSSRVYGRRCYN